MKLQLAPFELVYGRKPKVPLDLIFPDVKLNLFLPPEGYASQIQVELNKAFDHATSNRDIRMEGNLNFNGPINKTSTVRLS